MDNKDLIKQYVNTGVILTDYQLSNINSNLMTSYKRVRFAGITQGDGIRFVEHEYKYLNNHEKAKYTEILVSSFRNLSSYFKFKVYEYNFLPENIKSQYREHLVNNAVWLNEPEFEILSPDEINQYMVTKLNKIKIRFEYLVDAELAYVLKVPELHRMYFDAYLNNLMTSGYLNAADLQKLGLTDSMKDEFWKALIKRAGDTKAQYSLSIWDDEVLFHDMPEKYIRPYFTAAVDARIARMKNNSNSINSYVEKTFENGEALYAPKDLKRKLDNYIAAYSAISHNKIVGDDEAMLIYFERKFTALEYHGAQPSFDEMMTLYKTQGSDELMKRYLATFSFMDKTLGVLANTKFSDLVFKKIIDEGINKGVHTIRHYSHSNYITASFVDKSRLMILAKSDKWLKHYYRTRFKLMDEMSGAEIREEYEHELMPDDIRREYLDFLLTRLENDTHTLNHIREVALAIATHDELIRYGNFRVKYLKQDGNTFYANDLKYLPKEFLNKHKDLMPRGYNEQ
jgi:hypothetical protein